MKKVHILPSVITAFGLTCGLFIIFRMNMLPAGAATYPFLSRMAMILLFAAFADLLDGTIARAIKAESEFGGTFDSLADAVTFGVAPTVIVLKTLSIEPGAELSFLLTASAMIFSVCGVLRLVRFTVSGQVAKTDMAFFASSTKNFTGLPIPGAAAALVSLNLLLSSIDLRDYGISEKMHTWISILMMIFLGYLMVSSIKFPSLKSFQFRMVSFRIVLMTVVMAVLFFYGIFHHFSIVFVAISWIYILIALFLALIRKFYARKSGPFIDFDPDLEDPE